MSDEFASDLQRCRSELDAARGELLAVVTSLRDDDLDRGRRGQWPVRRILEHVIYSEQGYARVVGYLRKQPVESEIPASSPSTAADAVDLLAASRSALLAELDGVDEDTFYRIGKLGHEEYSVLSMLENEINHEREHAAQISALMGSG